MKKSTSCWWRTEDAAAAICLLMAPRLTWPASRLAGPGHPSTPPPPDTETIDALPRSDLKCWKIPSRRTVQDVWVRPPFFLPLVLIGGKKEKKKKKKHKELIRLPPTAKLCLSHSLSFFFVPVSHVFTPVAASLGHWDRSVFFFFPHPFLLAARNSCHAC